MEDLRQQNDALIKRVEELKRDLAFVELQHERAIYNTRMHLAGSIAAGTNPGRVTLGDIDGWAVAVVNMTDGLLKALLPPTEVV